MPTSTAYILIQSLGYRYSFDGVTSISHALSLKLSQDSDASSGADFTTTARNDPDVVTLSVVATDTGSPVPGWARQTLTSLAQIKEKLLPCRVVTPLRTYSDMLLSSISVQQDDTVPEGWTGTLTFTKAAAPSGEGKSDDNGSTPVSTGTAAARRVPASGSGSGASSSGAGAYPGSVLQVILREAGVIW